MEITVNRLQEIVAQETGLNVFLNEESVTIRFEDTRTELPDLKFLIIRRYNDRYVELLSGISSGYNPQWVPNRQMNARTKFLVYKLIR